LDEKPPYLFKKAAQKDWNVKPDFSAECFQHKVTPKLIVKKEFSGSV